MSKVAVLGVATRSGSLSPENRGNFLHATAARRLLTDYIEVPAARIWTDEEVEQIKTCSHVIVVMANGINLTGNRKPYPWQSITRQNLEQINLPIIVFGLGSQAPLEGVTDHKIHPDTLALLELVSLRSHYIAVRGEYTADILRKNEIKNTYITGCQSAFWHGENFPFVFNSLSLQNISHQRVLFNYSMLQDELQILHLGYKNNFTLVGQTELFEEHAVLCKPYKNSRMLKFFSEFEITETEYVEWVKAHFFTFCDIYEGMSKCKGFRFSFGTRFHGNMMACLSGVQSLWIVHDMRTKELCDALSLPCCLLKEILSKPISLQDLIEKSNFSAFLRDYPANYRRFYQYLRLSGLRN